MITPNHRGDEYVTFSLANTFDPLSSDEDSQLKTKTFHSTSPTNPFGTTSEATLEGRITRSPSPAYSSSNIYEKITAIIEEMIQSSKLQLLDIDCLAQQGFNSLSMLTEYDHRSDELHPKLSLKTTWKDHGNIHFALRRALATRHIHPDDSLYELQKRMLPITTYDLQNDFFQDLFDTEVLAQVQDTYNRVFKELEAHTPQQSFLITPEQKKKLFERPAKACFHKESLNIPLYNLICLKEKLTPVVNALGERQECDFKVHEHEDHYKQYLEIVIPPNQTKYTRLLQELLNVLKTPEDNLIGLNASAHTHYKKSYDDNGNEIFHMFHSIFIFPISVEQLQDVTEDHINCMLKCIEQFNTLHDQNKTI
jgi:hypothetical protein